MVKSSFEEGFSALDVMIRDGMASMTGTIAEIPFNDPSSLEWKEKIFQILVQTAVYVKRPTDCAPFFAKVALIGQEAKETSDAVSLAAKIKALRLESRALLCRDESQIRQLIEEKRTLKELANVFDVCAKAIAAAPALAKRQVIELQGTINGLDARFPAVANTKRILEDRLRVLNTPPPPPKPIERAEPQPTLSSKAWRAFTYCTRSLFSLFSRLFSR